MIYILLLIFLMKKLIDNSKLFYLNILYYYIQNIFIIFFFYKIFKLLQFKLFRTTKNDMKLKHNRYNNKTTNH